MQGPSNRRAGRHRRDRAGMTLIEVVVSMAVIATILMASAAAFSQPLIATDRAKRTTGAAIFLETTMENISAQSFDNLLALNGNTIFDQTSALDSRYAINLTVFVPELNLIQIQAVVTDLRSNDPVGRLTSLMSRR